MSTTTIRHTGVDFGPIKLDAFGPIKLDPDACEECGGSGEWVCGDGGENGRATDTGCTATCTACDGTGQGGLLAVARDAVRLLAESTESATPDNL